MTDGRRGRSKTQKLCLLSIPVSPNPSLTPNASSQSLAQPMGQHSNTLSHVHSSSGPHILSLRRDRHPRHSSPPSALSRNSPYITKQQHVRTPGGSIRPKNLNRIKSLSKIEIKSPKFRKTFSHGISLANSPENESRPPAVLERTSLNSLKSSQSLSTRIFSSIIPRRFHKIRNFYNDFTTIDWVKAYVAQNRLNFELQHRHWIVENNELQINSEISVLYKLYMKLSKWILIILIGFVFSIVAYVIDKFEIVLVGLKDGYCQRQIFYSQQTCCTTPGCPEWVSWTQYFEGLSKKTADFMIFVFLTVFLGLLACVITLSTKTVSNIGSKNDAVLHFDNNSSYGSFDDNDSTDPDSSYSSNSAYSTSIRQHQTEKTIYTAAGSGVPEVKTILSGFVIRKFLGSYTLFAKTTSLIAAIASGMALGKEGPYVHIATCIGNICLRLFPHLDNNELMKKQILSASASSGVALAFGSPIGGVLFILEEINNHLPSNQLFLIFFCAIISTLFLKFLNPYGTGKTVLFELNYSSDWSPIELVFFVIIGIAGGCFGAAFIKFVKWWPGVFRQSKFIKGKPKFEVFLIALFTGLVSFWNPYTKQAASELVLDLATPCLSDSQISRSLCPVTVDLFYHELGSLTFAFITKLGLTFITFGLKLPCGIYVPSMVLGALFGRIFGMLIKYLHFIQNNSLLGCPFGPGNCIDLGIYSMISAGAFMAGVTRMNVTLVTILFELTSSYTYVLPIAIAISVANWMGSIIEPNSLYESLLIINDYPFMTAESEPLDPFLTTSDIIEDCEKFNGEETSKLNQVTNKRAQYINQPHQLPRVTSELISDFVPIDDINDNRKLYIDVTTSSYVPVSTLRSKLQLLSAKGLHDGCISIVSTERCIGLIFFSELEYAVDKIDNFCNDYGIHDEIYCKLVPDLKDHASETAQLLIRSNQTTISNIINNSSTNLSVTDYFSFGTIATDDALLLEIQQTFYDLIDLTDSIDYNPIFINYDSSLTLASLIFERIGTRVIVLLKDGKYYGVLHKKGLIDYCRSDHILKY